jgi:hypothetical protein
MGDISKLPKWAQDEFAALANENQKLRDQLEKQIKTQKKTRVSVPYVYGLKRDSGYYLDDDMVRFQHGDTDREYVDVRLRQERGKLLVEIMAGDTLEIMPRAGNCVWLRTEK